MVYEIHGDTGCSSYQFCLHAAMFLNTTVVSLNYYIALIPFFVLVLPVIPYFLFSFSEVGWRG